MADLLARAVCGGVHQLTSRPLRLMAYSGASLTALERGSLVKDCANTIVALVQAELVSSQLSSNPSV